LSLALLIFSAFLAAIGQILLKIGAQGRQALLEFINMPIAAGLLLYGGGVLIWIYVLSHEKLTNVYAFTALTFVLVYVGAVVFLAEKISLLASIGVFLILLGLYLIANHNVH
jgi:drug/metabolite transporter (DMT)-like permease